MSASGAIFFDESLAESAAYADQTSEGLKSRIDAYIAREGIDAPAARPDPEDTVRGRFPDPTLLELDLLENGIGTVISATGVTGDFSWLKVPDALDADGLPVQEASVSVPGVFFAGLDSKAAQRAGTVLSAAFEADRVAGYLTAAPGSRTAKARPAGIRALDSRCRAADGPLGTARPTTYPVKGSLRDTRPLSAPRSAVYLHPDTD
ncbi:hypothetical protein [Jannaschia seohaensis]|uniref:hypothetical protein n=1 Tax=Jannaschia seohaensis TaxID=475081 RepID=UPI000D6D2DA8|nr:hypothetical protein [Jannaschia seohaensis]